MAIPGATAGDPPTSCDAVIIGAGVQGLALAFELAERGMTDVVVLDARFPGSGASGRNGELIRSAFASIPWIRLFDRSLRLWHDLSARLDYNVLFVGRGYTVIASTDEEMTSWGEVLSRQAAYGLRTRRVSSDEIAELVRGINTDLAVGGLHQADGGFAHHDAVVWGYARAAARAGVAIHPYTTVLDVLVEGDRARGVVTDRGTISAPIVVNAAGAQSREVAALAGVELPVRRCRLEAMVTESLMPFMDTAISAIGIHSYAHQTSRGEFVGGTELEQPDPSNSLRGTQPLLFDMAHKFSLLIPRLAGVRMVRHWAGLVSQTEDMGPVLGRVPEVEGLFLTCGWLYGFMAAPAAGDQLAETIVTGRESDLIAPFGIERLRAGELVTETSLIHRPDQARAATGDATGE
jgi:heterotetrameric sarcosine oxidase beta subunit